SGGARGNAGPPHYNRLVGGLDQWIAEKTATKRGSSKDPTAQKRMHLAKMRLAMGKIADKNAKPVNAVFHPSAQYKPWEANLSRLPLSLWYWADGDTWHLTDLTNPARTPEVTGERGKAADGNYETTPGRD